MTELIRRYRFGYALGSVLCILGFSAVAFVVWKAWPETAGSSNPVSAFWGFLWAEDIHLIPSVRFKLFSVVVLAVALLLLGVGVVAFSRQRFFLPGAAMKLQCPFCSKFWSAGYDRGQVLCPHCRHLVHPRIVKS